MSRPPRVATASGDLAGAWRAEVAAFLGVPYALARRWAPPVPPPSWRGVHDASRPKPAAPQPRRPVAAFTHGALPLTGEDCLGLALWTPALSGSRPVLVWLHGGGFTIGHPTASLYEGGALAAAGDVVVVSVGYRLGTLGWLGHPALAACPGAPAANWGLLDQIAALRWVAENIAAFGGDPRRVTLAGQSAGALCAMDLLVAPAAAGLFSRAILQSPPLRDVAQPPDRAWEWARALSHALTGREELDPGALRSLPAERIVAAHEALLDTPSFAGTRGGALPTIDPATLPESPLERPGASPGVDVLIGHTADEGTFFFGSPWRPAPPVERIPAILAHLGAGEPERPPAGLRAEDDADPLARLRRAATEQLVAAPAARWAGARAAAVSAAAGRVYRYRFDHPGAGPDLRATHTAEVPLLFSTWRDGGPGERLGGQQVSPDLAPTAEVAAALQRAWVAFIHGDELPWRPLAPGESTEVATFGGRAPFAVDTEHMSPAGL